VFSPESICRLSAPKTPHTLIRVTNQVAYQSVGTRNLIPDRGRSTSVTLTCPNTCSVHTSERASSLWMEMLLEAQTETTPQARLPIKCENKDALSVSGVYGRQGE
jgi:hypothetical protein